MTFAELLQNSRDAIVQRWLDAALATYPENSSAMFKRQKDPFANPIGHGLRMGTRGIFEALLEGMGLDGMDAEKIHRSLCEIVKVRAVQEFSASEAVSFVFCLKDAVRAELAEATADQRFLPEFTKLETQIDQIALAAFDVYVKCREQLFELRVNEAKRRVAWVVEKMNERGSDREETPDHALTAEDTDG